MADVQDVLPAESAGHDADEWLDTPMDSTVELSADGGEQDLFSAYIRGYGYFLAPSPAISLCCPIHRSSTQQSTATWSQRLVRAQQKWIDMLPLLIDAYLKFKHDGRSTEHAAGDTFSLPIFDVYGNIYVINLRVVLSYAD